MSNDLTHVDLSESTHAVNRISSTAGSFFNSLIHIRSNRNFEQKCANACGNPDNALWTRAPGLCWNDSSKLWIVNRDSCKGIDSFTFFRNRNQRTPYLHLCLRERNLQTQSVLRTSHFAGVNITEEERQRQMCTTTTSIPFVVVFVISALMAVVLLELGHAPLSPSRLS